MLANSLLVAFLRMRRVAVCSYLYRWDSQVNGMGGEEGKWWQYDRGR